MDARSILIVVIILFLLYYVVSSFLTSSGLTRMGGAEEEITVPASKLRSGGSANSSYSIWFYVDDWATRYGEEKVIFERGGEAATNGIQVVMGAHTNDLIVKVSTLATGGAMGAGAETGDGDEIVLSAMSGADNCSPTEGDSPYTDFGGNCVDAAGDPVAYYVHKDAKKNGDPIPQPNGNAGKCATPPANYYGKPGCSTDDGTGVTNSGASQTSGFTLLNGVLSHRVAGREGLVGDSVTEVKTCKVRNVPVQKWVNVIVSFNNTTLDVYMNGKLVKTCIMSNPAEIDASHAVVITPTGRTFSGKTAKFNFWNTPMDPQKAWYTYGNGFAPGLGIMSYFAKYKFKMSLLENNIETTSLTI